MEWMRFFGVGFSPPIQIQLPRRRVTARAGLFETPRPTRLPPVRTDAPPRASASPPGACHRFSARGICLRCASAADRRERFRTRHRRRLRRWSSNGAREVVPGSRGDRSPELPPTSAPMSWDRPCRTWQVPGRQKLRYAPGRPVGDGTISADREAPRPAWQPGWNGPRLV